MSEWKHKEEWRRSGTDFCVVVSRHEGYSDKCRGAHRWCVYAYIYPTHARFKRFDKAGNMFQDACTELPLHSGPSFFVAHEKDGAITSFQVGADYHHLYDDAFTHMATKDDAHIVFEDAGSLYDWLAERAK